MAKQLDKLDPRSMALLRNALRAQARELGHRAREAEANGSTRAKTIRENWRTTRQILNTVKSVMQQATA